MNLPLFAKALGAGIERAALLSYAEARAMLGGEGVSEVLRDESCEDWVNWEIDAIQILDDFHGECIELWILVSDGHKDMKAYFYARAEIPDAT